MADEYHKIRVILWLKSTLSNNFGTMKYINLKIILPFMLDVLKPATIPLQIKSD